MATRFIPTVERESIDLVYVFSHILISELTDGSPSSSDRNVAGQFLLSPQELVLIAWYSLE